MVRSPRYGDYRLYRSLAHALKFGRKGSKVYKAEVTFVEVEDE